MIDIAENCKYPASRAWYNKLMTLHKHIRQSSALMKLLKQCNICLHESKKHI